MSVQLFCYKCRAFRMFLVGKVTDQQSESINKQVTCECCKNIHLVRFARVAA